MRGSTLFNGSLIRSHIWGTDLSGSSQGAGGVGGLLVSRIGGADYYPLYDGNGNVTEYRNASSTVAHFEYDAFGAVSSFTGPMWDFNLRFSTKYEDFETGLNYYGYRYYDPQLGRWSSRDPLNELGRNGYFSAMEIYQKFLALSENENLISLQGDPESADLVNTEFEMLRNYIEVGNADESTNLYLFSENDGLNRYDVLGLDNKPKRDLSCEGFNKKSDPKDIEKALKEARENGQKKRAKALQGLLKVVKRGGRLLGVPLQALGNAWNGAFGSEFSGIPREYYSPGSVRWN